MLIASRRLEIGRCGRRTAPASISPAAAAHLGPGNAAGQIVAAKPHDPPQARELLGRQLPRRGGGQLRANFAKHREVVGRLEAIDEKQGHRVALIQHVLQLERPIGRIDRHQHRANPRRGKLQHDPLGHVRGPDGDVLARPDAQGQQAAGRLRSRARRIADTRAVSRAVERRGRRRPRAPRPWPQALGRSSALRPKEPPIRPPSENSAVLTGNRKASCKLMPTVL